MNNHKSYYKNNKVYSRIVENQPKEQFVKYVDYIVKYTKNGETFLDVGCGTGLALELLKKNNIRCTGVDVAIPSLQLCQKKGLNCLPYDGEKLPFESATYDSVGSYNVLEHTDHPVAFLAEQLRVLKKGGHLIVACPNFLSITNNYHNHTRGMLRKAQNLIQIIYKLFSPQFIFDKMDVIHRAEFQPDDDACNVTNPVDLLKWAKCNNLRLLYWSSQSFYKIGPINYFDISLFRFIFGSSFLIFRKND